MAALKSSIKPSHMLFASLSCLLIHSLSWRVSSAAAATPTGAPPPSPAVSGFPPDAPPPCDADDQDFLLLFKLAMATVAPGPLDMWSSDTSCCTWPGVRCSNTSSTDASYVRVEELRLSQVGLIGSIERLPWASLAGLKSLDLSSNGLSESLPAELPQMSLLQKLDLSGNMLSGNLSALWRCAATPLVEVDVSRNNLSGPLVGFVTLSSSTLEVLNVSANGLSGPWPQGLHHMTRLRAVDASRNSITGELPQFPNCTMLVHIDLSSNGFSGTFDTSICVGKPNLRSLNISWNGLSGGMLSDVSRCSTLELLDVSFNKLTGSLPAALFSLARLVHLSMSYNNFNGSISKGLGNLTNLQTLLLADNELTGCIPADIGKLRKLKEIDVSSNSITGGLPGLSNCSSLISLSARWNIFGGRISLAFGNLPHLRNLDLGFNNFGGGVPATLGLCTELETVVLTGNFITGPIPPELGGLKKLKSLSLSKNGLSGDIPSDLAGCTSLVSLILTKNSRLGIALPGASSLFPNLQVLALGSCNLEGQISDWIGGCSKLEMLDVSWNRLTGPLPAWIGSLEHLIYVDLSNNGFTGVLPIDISASPSFSMEQQQVNADKVGSFPPSLLLSGNRLDGVIPPEYGKMKRLMSLDLGRNKLSGAIPETLSNLHDLKFLDLAGNRLSGVIPASLSSLGFLVFFDVSRNKLSGPIPRSGRFPTFPNSSFLDNPDLCGPPLETQCRAPVDMPDARQRQGNGGWDDESTVIYLPAFCIGFCAAFSGTCSLLVINRRLRSMVMKPPSRSPPSHRRRIVFFTN